MDAWLAALSGVIGGGTLLLGAALATVAAALTGFLAFQSAPPEVTALVTTIAAGGLLAMICNTMIPEALEKQRVLTGLCATLGFLLAFALHQIA